MIYLIIIIIISYFISLSSSSITCQYNLNCNSICVNSQCSFSSSTQLFNLQDCCAGCKSQYFYDSNTKNCIQNSCSKDQFGIQQYWWFGNNTCLYQCPMEILYSFFQMQPWVGVNSTGRCQQKCPLGSYSAFMKQGRICISQCKSMQIYNFVHKIVSCFNNDNQSCDFCLPASGYYRNNYSMTCVKDCKSSASYFANEITKYCIHPYDCNWPYYGNYSYNYWYWTSSNYNTCKISPLPISYNINLTSGHFIQRCSNGLFYDPTSGYCVINCTQSQTKQLYNDYISMRCARIGQYSFNEIKKINTFGVNTSMNCQQSCQFGSYGYLPLKLCVKQCFGDYGYSNLWTWMCVNTLSQSTQNYASITLLIIIACVMVGIMIVMIVISLCIYKRCQNKMIKKMMQKVKQQQQKGITQSQWSEKQLKGINDNKQVNENQFMMNRQ